MNFGFTPRQLEIIEQVITSFQEIEKAIIFGSRAKGNYKPGSDVDIALMGNAVTSDTAGKLADQLNEETPLPFYFDVLDFRSIENVKLKEHIERAGQLLFVRE